MKDIDENQKIEQAGRLFKEFITYHISIGQLADQLDELMLEYGRFLIEEDTPGYKQRGDKFHLIYQLRRICELKGPD